MNYYVAATLCISSLMIGIFSFKENELISIRRKKCFVILALILIAEIIFDTISFAIDGNSAVSVLLYRIVKAIEFSLAPAIPAMFSMIISRRSYWGKIRTWFAALIGINVIMQLVSIFTPIMFEITDDLHYTRTIMGYTYLINLFTGCILLIISSRHMVVQNTKHTSITLILLVCLIAIGILLRIILDNCNSDWLTITITYFAMTIYFNNNHLKVDSTTGLLNRNAFNNKFAGIEKKYSTAFVFIDANNLKKINDSEGHGKGDWVLSRIADCILQVYGKHGFCYRYGGDEFVVIFKPGVIRKSTEDIIYFDKYAMIERMMARLDKKLKKILEATDDNKEKVALSYGVSQGYGIYYTEEDKPAEIDYKTAEEAFRMADVGMYNNKREYKKAMKQKEAENLDSTENQEPVDNQKDSEN